MANNTTGKTAFVFAGGGSFGAIQVGMLRGLVAYGLRPDFVVGSSVGAINCAYFAGDPTAAGVARLENIWTGLKRREVFPVTWGHIAGFFPIRLPWWTPMDCVSSSSATCPTGNSTRP